MWDVELMVVITFQKKKKEKTETVNCINIEKIIKIVKFDEACASRCLKVHLFHIGRINVLCINYTYLLKLVDLKWNVKKKNAKERLL